MAAASPCVLRGIESLTPKHTYIRHKTQNASHRAQGFCLISLLIGSPISLLIGSPISSLIIPPISDHPIHLFLHLPVTTSRDNFL